LTLEIEAEYLAIDVQQSIRHPRDIVTIEQTQVGDKVVLHVAGRMDAESAHQFELRCESCIAEGFTSIVIDLSDLTYISSLGLRSVVAVANKARNKGGELRICGMTGLVRQVFEITKLSQVFPLHESVESALLGG
jgi:anti-anti-sigma factor